MSVLINENLYVVRAYTEKEAAESVLINAGFRLSVIRWRETTKKVAAGETTHQTMCVLVHEIPLVIEKPKLLQDALRKSLDNLQDQRIKAVCENWLATGGQLQAFRIIPEEVNERGIKEWSDEEATGGRLSGDIIQQWFDASLRDPLVAQFTSKGASQETAAKAGNGYAATFKKLASPAALMSADVLSKLTDALSLVPEANRSRIDEQLVKAIIRRMPKSDDELLLGL